MSANAALPEHLHIPLTRFHNNTGEFLDMSLRSPIVLTNHGRAKHIIADPTYFARIEQMAAGNLRAALNLNSVAAAAMPLDHRAIFQAARPSSEEIANDRWTDDSAA